MHRTDGRVRAQHRRCHAQRMFVGCWQREPAASCFNDRKQRVAIGSREKRVARFVSAAREPFKPRARQVVADSH